MMKSLDSILTNYCPPGEDIDAHLPRIVDDHLEDILGDLPRRSSLPMPHELREGEISTQLCPIVIEETIAIAAVRKHLLQTDPNTPEIGITIFGNSTQVLEVGTPAGIISHRRWKPFQPRSSTHFHTHPNPTEAERMRHPSFGDLTHALKLGRPIAIGSRNGLTCVPPPKVEQGSDCDLDSVLGLWNEYVLRVRCFDKDSLDKYGPERVRAEFLADVVGTSFIDWDSLDGETSLAEAILAQRESSPTLRS